VREHVDADIEAYLKQRGLRSRSEAPWMFLTKRPLSSAAPESVQVRITSAAADLLRLWNSLIIPVFV